MSLISGYGIDIQRHIVKPTGTATSRLSTIPATALGRPGRRSGADVRARPTSPNKSARIAIAKLSRNIEKPAIGKTMPRWAPRRPTPSSTAASIASVLLGVGLLGAHLG